jgi:competence protein ComEC
MLRQQLREIPFLKFLIPFIAGIMIGYYSIQSGLSERYMFFYGCSLFFILIYLFTHNKTYRKWNALLVHLLFLSAGFLIEINHYQLLNKDHFSKHTSSYFLISVYEPPVIKKDFIRFPARVIQNEKGERLSGKLLMYISKDPVSEKLKYGDQILIRTNYNEVSRAGNPGEFDYKKFLADKNIFHQQFVKKNEWVFTGNNSGKRILIFSTSAATYLVKVFRENIKNDEVFNVVSTLVLGYRADLSPEVVSSYANTGTLHILSVSGLHVGIIYIVLNFVLSFLDKRKSTLNLKTLILIFLVWLYAFISGLSPSVCRSAMMISFMISAKSFNRSTNIYNIICASAFLLLIYDPAFLFDIGFLLSYIAVLSIIYFQPKIYHLVVIENKWIDKIWLLTSVSMAAQVGTFPLSLYFFHQFPNYFLIANLLAIPLATVILYLGILLLIVGTIPVINSFVSILLSYTVQLMNTILHQIELLPFAYINRVWISFYDMILMYALLLLLISFFVFRYKNAFKYSLFVLIFLSAEYLYHTIFIISQKRLLVLNNPKNIVVVGLSGNHAKCFSEKEIHASGKSFLLEPLLGKYGIKKEYYDTGKTVINFYDQKLMIITDTKVFDHINQPYKVDYLVTNMKNINPELMLKKIEYKTLIYTPYLTDKGFEELTKKSALLDKKFFSTHREGVFVYSE